MRLLIFLSIFAFSFINIKIDKKGYYESLSINSIEEIELMIRVIKKEPVTSLSKAYQGTLIAKKASYLKNTTEKIKTFKEGVGLLEKEITLFPKNIEYRFLRLTIQENCPKILKYNKDVENDAKIITKGYSTLNNELKEAIIKYAKTSKVLNRSNLK